MSSLEPADPEIPQGNKAARKSYDDKHDVERIASTTEDMGKGDQARFHHMDDEVAKYAGAEAVQISEQESTRLRKMIDKRVLLIMIVTYFLQAIDKGTLSFAYVHLPECLSIQGHTLSSDSPQRTGICTDRLLVPSWVCQLIQAWPSPTIPQSPALYGLG